MFMNSNNTIDILKYYDSLTKNEISDNEMKIVKERM